MLDFKIIFLITYPIFLLAAYWVFILLAKRLHNQNLQKLGISSRTILEENYKRMVHYVRISMIALFITSTLFLFIILW